VVASQPCAATVTSFVKQAQDKLTISQLAEMLDIKQEVAYFLVRQGLVAS